MKKVCTAIIALIIIVGIVMTCTMGLNFDLKYQKNQSIEFNLGQEYDEKEIREITSEVFENQRVAIQAIEVYKDAVKITTTEITEEQKENLITKINEKYGIELDANSIEIEENANIKGRTIIKPYITSSIIVIALIVIYQMIRFRKLNTFLMCAKEVLALVISELLLLSFFAITRIPVGEYITVTILVVFILTIGMMNTKFEKDLEKKKEEEK